MEPAPLLTKAAASSSGQTREEGPEGRTDTPGTPPQQQPSLPGGKKRGRKAPSAGGSRAPRGDQRLPILPAKGWAWGVEERPEWVATLVSAL